MTRSPAAVYLLTLISSLFVLKAAKSLEFRPTGGPEQNQNQSGPQVKEGPSQHETNFSSSGLTTGSGQRENRKFTTNHSEAEPPGGLFRNTEPTRTRTLRRAPENQSSWFRWTRTRTNQRSQTEGSLQNPALKPSEHTLILTVSCCFLFRGVKLSLTQMFQFIRTEQNRRPPEPGSLCFSWNSLVTH